MARRTHPLREWMLQHPSVDHAPGIAVAVAILTTNGFTTLGDGDRTTLVIGVTTIAALVMAAATFICSMTYQSANILLTRVRQNHASALRRNWFSIIVGAFYAATLPILTLLVAQQVTVTVALCLYSLALVTARFLRAVFWMSFTLFMQEADDIRPTTRIARPVGDATPAP